MHNQKLARSLKKGCNDHIEELAIIKDKLVSSEVKQISNKHAKTTPATDKNKKKRQTAEETIGKSKKKGQATEEKKECLRTCWKTILYQIE